MEIKKYLKGVNFREDRVLEVHQGMVNDHVEETFQYLFDLILDKVSMKPEWKFFKSGVRADGVYYFTLNDFQRIEITSSIVDRTFYEVVLTFNGFTMNETKVFPGFYPEEWDKIKDQI